MNDLSIPLSGGRVTSRDAADLSTGELREAMGVYYRPGDPSRIWALPTRQAYTASLGGTFKGLVLCQFDDSTKDLLVAFVGTDLKLINLATGAVTSAGLTLAGAGPLSAAFADPRWYLCTNGDPLYALESTGTIYRAGMRPPDVQPVVATASAGSTVTQPNVYPASAGWNDPAKAADADLTSAAYSTISGFSPPVPQIWSFSAGGAVARTLSIVWSVTVVGNVTLAIDYSVDSGANWIPLESGNYSASTGGTISVATAAALTAIQIRAYTPLLTYGIATLRISDIREIEGSAVAPFTPVTGLYYAFGEYDQARGQYSYIGPVSALVSGTFATATMPLPTAAKNSRSTHWVIYRTADEGVAPQQLGQLAVVPITDTSFRDNFNVYAFDAQPLPVLRMLEVDGLFFPLDLQPPVLSHVGFFRGALVGPTITGDFQYSEDGGPESWPAINTIPRGQFPFPEHDVPRGTMTVGEVLVILCDGSVVTINALPRIANGQLNNAELTQIRGQAGVVGVQAFCTYSVSGEPRGAWVTPYGVAVTNGQTADRISDDMDWESEKGSNPAQTVLRWLPDTLALELVVDRATAYLLHVGSKHLKSTGAKVTRASAPVSSLAGGLIGGIFRLFSAHATEGKVYREQYAGAEAGRISPGLIFDGGREFEVYKMRLRHSGFGDTDVATVSCTMRRDDFPDAGSPVTVVVALAGDKGSEFYVGRAGEYADITITTTGPGSLLDLKARVRSMGSVGKVAV